MGIDNISSGEGVKREGAITIFWKDGSPMGMCRAGEEESWLEEQTENSASGQLPDRQTSSTEENWNDYARVRADLNISEDEAQRYL